MFQTVLWMDLSKAEPSTQDKGRVQKTAASAVAKGEAPVAKEVRDELAARARAAFYAGRAAAFRVLAREAHGVNDQNRAAISAQADAAGRQAAADVYKGAGYKPCAGEGCDRLCTPGYALCPKCAS